MTMLNCRHKLLLCPTLRHIQKSKEFVSVNSFFEGYVLKTESCEKVLFDVKEARSGNWQADENPVTISIFDFISQWHIKAFYRSNVSLQR